MRIFFLILALWGGCSATFAQGEGNNWYISFLGISFNNDTVTLDYNWPTEAVTATSTISDCQGNLLFYCDFQSVYDRNHNTMPNGALIFGTGNVSVSAPVLVVPDPGDDNLYYVFNNTPPELRYSVVDMRLNNGLGDVTATRQVLLYGNSDDILAGTKHANNRDIWVTTMDAGTHNLLAYLVTPTGITTSPVVSNITYTVPPIPPTSGFASRFSPQGDKFVFSEFENGSYVDHTLNLFQFNNATGGFGNQLSIGNNGLGAFEFSPNGKKLYASDSVHALVQVPTATAPIPEILSDIKQYDLSSWNIASVQASEQVVASPPPISNWSRDHVAMQLAPNGRIYILSDNFNYLSTIYYPNVAGPACTFVDSALYIYYHTFQFGFQNFISSFFNPAPHRIVAADTVCLGGVAAFAPKDTVRLDSIRWDFGDPFASGDTSRMRFPTYNYTQTGTYAIRAVTWYRCRTDTLYDTITVVPGYLLDLGNDTALCNNDSIWLDATQTTPAIYQWQDGSTASTLTANAPGAYWVQVSGVCPTQSDTVTVAALPQPTMLLGNDTSLCGTASLMLTPVTNVADYQWQDGSTTPTYTVTVAGTYWVQAGNNCGSARDSIVVGYVVQPVVGLGSDTDVCFNTGDIIRLDAGQHDTYRWNDSSSDRYLDVVQAGTYWVMVTDGPCTASAMVDITDSCLGAVSIPNAFTPNGDGHNDVFRVLGNGLTDVRMRVFDRWGEKVFDGDGQYRGWDGTVKGQPAATGAYVYFVTYTDPQGRQQERRGSVTLLR